MDVDTNSLKIFRAVLSEGSFSAAARALKVSQPSVSQMIGRLEVRLGNPLFERVGHEVLPTRLALELSGFAESILGQVEQFATRLEEGRTSLTGLVRFAKPESCLWTPYYRTIMRELKDLPDLHIDIDIATNAQIIEGIASDKYDFGFVVGERIQSELRFESFGHEEYVAVHGEGLKNFVFGPSLKNLRLIAYPGWEDYAEVWFKAHGLWSKFRTLDLTPVVKVGNLAGAIHAAEEGAGIGIFPMQCVRDSLNDKCFKRIDPRPGIVAKSGVHMARRRSFHLPARVDVVMTRLRRTVCQS